MFPSPSPVGSRRTGGDGAGVHLNECYDNLLEDITTQKDLEKVFSSFKPALPRLASGERLDGFIKRKPNGFLPKEEVRRIVGTMPTRQHSGLRGAAVKLLNSKCSTIRKFLKVWTWIDTCLALAFPEESAHITHFKVKWWCIIAHDIVSSVTIHYACKKWSQFALYLNLHYGGAVQPTPKWESWFPTIPKGSWMEKSPDQLSRLERAYCRILSDKRGLPSGDQVTKRKALDSHMQAITKGDTMSPEDKTTLAEYSEIAAEEIRKVIPDNWFKRQSGHISISNSSCVEATRSEGGKRGYILSCLWAWLLESPTVSQIYVLPTGESVVEEAGRPRWATVKPPHMAEAQDVPSGIRRSTGLFTEDFADGEQERVGFQLFAWAFCTLVSGHYLDSHGVPTGKPLPITRVALGEPGCKVRIATRSMAALVVYGQPFAHSMRELLESHPALKAGLGSGYQLWEWLKHFQEDATLPDYVMIGDFESATDHIQHNAGIIAMDQLLDKLNADRNGYAKNYVRLLLSPRELTEDGVVTITNSGCLMGEPGSKIVLTFLALVANCYAHRDFPSQHFATAGDDQIDASSNLQVLLSYAEASRITTMIPSSEKWGIYRYSAVYCQQLLDIRSASPREAEIPIPKPRLLSAESKTGRGDHEVNPAYGKAKQFAKEYLWCPFTDLRRCMLFAFLKNMRSYIEAKPEAFLPTEWGGLGLPGLKPAIVAGMLPQWHQNLIHAREAGDESASKVLARWATSRNFTRGMAESADDVQGMYRDLISEYMPTASLNQIVDAPEHSNTRYKTRLEIAQNEGWIPLESLLRAISDSRLYANLWDLHIEGHRGYASLPWGERSKRMQEASRLIISQDFTAVPFPDNPGWKPTVMVLTDAYALHTRDYHIDGEEDMEDGELRQEAVPFVGQHASPRLFLHYDNFRLILNATSRKRYTR